MDKPMVVVQAFLSAAWKAEQKADKKVLQWAAWRDYSVADERAAC